MKTPLLFFLLLLSGSFTTLFAPGSLKAPGVYKMLSQSVTDGKETQHYTSHQLKIYTEHYMMYANVNPQDSSASFGVGSYTQNDNVITEHVIYSASDSLTDDTARDYRLNIEPTDKGYIQVIPNMDGAGKYTLTEEYETVNKGSTSPIDGLWKMTKHLSINGSDTTADAVTQYKAYYNGHFIWGGTYTDAGKKHTAIGFGTFDMNGADTVNETIEESSFTDINGQKFVLVIAMPSPDVYRQVIRNNNGTATLEEYTRLK